MKLPLAMRWRTAKGKIECPGDFIWEPYPGCDSTIGEHSTLLLAVPPAPGLEGHYELHRIACATDGGASEEIRKWNGEWAKPTINGSLDIPHFHVYIRKGMLVTAE